MKTILIIDDEPAILEVLCAILEEEGYHVVKAHNGKEGLERLAQDTTNLVLCDVMMPVLDGRAFCHRMQADTRYRAIPLVMMSAASGALNSLDCKYAATILKPFELDDLLDTIDRILAPI